MAKSLSSLGRQILAMAQAGQNVPLNVQQAATRLYQGAGGAADAIACRDFLRSKSGGIRGSLSFLKSVRAGVDELFGYSLKINQAVYGQDQASRTLASASLLNDAMGKMTEATRAKWAKSLAVAVGKAIGEDKTASLALLRNMGRVLPIAGTIVNMGLGVAEGVAWVAQQGENSIISSGRIASMQKASGMSPEVYREIAARARSRVKSRSWFGRGGLAQLFDYDTDTADVAQRSVGAIAALAELGVVNHEKAIQEYAIQNGKKPYYLSAREKRAAVLDATARFVMDNPEAQKWAESQYAVRHMKTRTVISWGSGFGTTPFGTARYTTESYDPNTKRQHDELIDALKEEYAKNLAETIKANVEAKRKFAEAQWESMPEWKKKEELELSQFGEKQLQGIRSRRKAWNYD